METLLSADTLIMAAAVADYRPAILAEQKIKKGTDDADLNIALARTTDILMAVKESVQRPTVVVGFAAESENLLENAHGKLECKGLDMLVANDITATDAGFGTDTNRVTILMKDGGSVAMGLQSKDTVAKAIIRQVAYLLREE